MSGTIVCIGTGPSVTQEQVDIARNKGFTLYACNNAIQLAPDAALLYAINMAWWDYYYDDVADLPCEKWTGRKDVADKYGINYIEGRDEKGLAPYDADFIHHGHGSGFSLLSMAHRARPERILLLGYDLRYAPDYDGHAKNPGSTGRHFFGEYPPSMQHWTKYGLRGGVHVGNLAYYAAVETNVYSCSASSALNGIFSYMDIARA